MHYTHEGVVISDNVASPWHDGILYIQGSVLMNEEGKRIADVALCEITDQDGDLCWFVFRNTLEYQIGQDHLIHSNNRSLSSSDIEPFLDVKISTGWVSANFNCFLLSSADFSKILVSF